MITEESSMEQKIVPLAGPSKDFGAFMDNLEKLEKNFVERHEFKDNDKEVGGSFGKYMDNLNSGSLHTETVVTDNNITESTNYLQI